MKKIINKLLFKINLKLRLVFPRPSVKFAKKYFNGKDIIVGEIGVYVGHNANDMLKRLNIERLYLIDPFMEHWEDDGDASLAESIARERLKDYNQITFIKKTSDNAINDIPKLDFLYIDGNHTYKFVKKDLNNYWNKINNNGIIAGHDFNIGTPGVMKAVMEFVNENNLKLNVDDYDWWIIKPGITYERRTKWKK